MKASILIPAFNAENTLSETLESCVLQGESWVEEIIVIDDHSVDGTKEIFEDFKKRYNKFKWVWGSNPKKGACSARNRAFSLSSGEFIQWLDADDILGEKKIERQIQSLLQNANSIAACPFRPFKGSVPSGLLHDPKIWDLPTICSKEDWLAANTMIVVHGWLTPRSIIQSAGPWDENLLLNQDGEFFCRVIATSSNVLFDKSVEVYYRKEGGGVSKFSAEKADSLFRSIESISRTALQVEDSNRMKQMISNRWQHFIYSVYPSRNDLVLEAIEKLRNLPKPDLLNPLTISQLSRLISRMCGWKTLVWMRVFRDRLRRR